MVIRPKYRRGGGEGEMATVLRLIRPFNPNFQEMNVITKVDCCKWYIYFGVKAIKNNCLLSLCVDLFSKRMVYYLCGWNYGSII